MFCPNCGAKNEEDAAFCGQCGFPLAEAASLGQTGSKQVYSEQASSGMTSSGQVSFGSAHPEQMHPKERSHRVLIILTIAVAALVVAAVTVYLIWFRPVNVNLTANLSSSDLICTGVNGDGTAELHSYHARKIADYAPGRRTNAFIDTVSYTIEPHSGLSNGDSVTVTARYSRTAAEQRHIKVTGRTVTLSVSGLSEEDDTVSETGDDSHTESNYNSEESGEDLDGLDSNELKLARNEIFARHGYRFKDADLQKYFESKTWYHPRGKAGEFDDSQLNKTEQYNVKWIIKHESQ